MKWRGPDARTFPNRAERAVYINAHPVPDEWEQKPRLQYEGEHPYEDGHPKITRDHNGRPLRWCVACHAPLFLGWYCGARCLKKRETCRRFVPVEGGRCPHHRTEVLEQRSEKKAQKKLQKNQARAEYKRARSEADVQHVTSTSQVRQIEWAKVDRRKPDAEEKRRASSEMRKGRVQHW